MYAQTRLIAYVIYARGKTVYLFILRIPGCYWMSKKLDLNWMTVGFNLDSLKGISQKILIVV